MAGNGKNGKKRRRWIWISVAALVLIAVIAGGVVALKPNNDIDPSKLAKVEKGDIARSVVATGKIQPLTKVEIKSKSSGIVKKLYVDYGEHVKAGQLLCELDKELLEAQVREAKATLQATEAAQESSKAALERNQVEAEGPDVPFMKKNMERAQQLYKDELVAKSAVEDAEKLYQMSLNKQTSALRSVALARAELSRSTAQVAQARAALDRAEEDLRSEKALQPA